MAIVRELATSSIAGEQVELRLIEFRLLPQGHTALW